MTTQLLTDAVKRRMQERWPGEEIYTDYLPKDFKRPSFALELQKEEIADLNIALVERRVTLLVTGFVKTDAYGDSDREKLNQRMEDACGLFAQGALPVGNRSIPVRTVRGTGAPDFFELTLLFSWVDERPGCSDDGVGPGGTPLMEHCELNITTKE